MRPVPNVSNNPDTEDNETCIDYLIERTQYHMHMGHGGQIDSSSKAAIMEFLNKPDTSVADLPEDSIEDTQSRLNDIIKSDLPDEFEYELTYDIEKGPMLRVTSGCPNCGNTAIFNGILEEHNQWVGHQEEENYSLHGVDDTTHSEVKFLRCGTCPEVLVDNQS